MPGLLRCTCGDYARVLHLNFAREAAGAAGTRHSLRPLISLGGGCLKNPDASRRGIAESRLGLPPLRGATCLRRRRHHAIAAVVLGAVERGVGALQRVTDGL